MLAHHAPRSPAPILACRGVRLRPHVRPNAFGNALGNSIVGQINQASQQEQRAGFIRAGASAMDAEYGIGIQNEAWAHQAQQQAHLERAGFIDAGRDMMGQESLIWDKQADFERSSARNGGDVDSDNYRGGRRVITIEPGKGLLGSMASQGYSAADRRALMGQLDRYKQLGGLNPSELQAGQQFYADLNDLTAADGRRGGALIAGETAARVAAANARSAQDASDQTRREMARFDVMRAVPAGVVPAYNNGDQIRGITPGFWEQIYGSPEVQKTMNNTITGQFIVKPVLSLFGQVSSVVRDDRYDFAQLRELNPVEAQRAKENLIINGGTLFIPGGAAVSAAARAERAAVSRVGNVGGAGETIATARSGQLADLLPESSLTRRQLALHEELSTPGTTATFRKGNVSMSDLVDLGRVTGDEYSMFTNGGRRLIIRGDGSDVVVSPEMYSDLLAGRYGRFSGHTHPPGYSVMPGPQDRPFLSSMGQERSTIWGFDGQTNTRYTFGQHGLADDGRIASEIARRNWARLYGE